MGIERLVLLLTSLEKVNNVRPQVDAYVAMLGDGVDIKANQLAEMWRDAVPEARIQCHCGGGNFKKQMKRADKSAASVAIILGEDEVAQQVATVKYLRERKEQISVPFDQVPSLLEELLD